MFRTIIADNFPPFGKLALELPPVPDKPVDLGEVHLFTGVNGTGKTRLFSLIAAVLGNPLPLKMRVTDDSSLMRIAVSNVVQTFPPPLESLFSHGVTQSSDSWAGFQLQHGALRRPPGLVTPLDDWISRVPAFAYRGSPYVGDAEVKSVVSVPPQDRQACLSFDRSSDASQALLQAISNLKMQASLDASNPQSSRRDKANAGKLVHALESSLTHITGFDFRFQLDAFPTMSLSVIWGGLELNFNALPDGLRAIIGWIVHALVMMSPWLQGNTDPMETDAVFLLDEIESHLHPAWQRRILPAFQHLFPKAQIFVATHSPFVIGSLNHGWIHQFKMTSPCQVSIGKPIPAKEGESYISVIEDIMGVKEWYDEETEGLLKEFRSKRDKAYHGDSEAEEEAVRLGHKIGARSMELEYMMGKELNQMNRQLAKTAGQK